MSDNTQAPFKSKLQLRAAEVDRRLVQRLEEPVVRDRPQPNFFVGFGSDTYQLPTSKHLEIHGTYLARRSTVLLFGPNHLVDRDGQWSCEALKFQEQFLHSFAKPAFDLNYPGIKPQLQLSDKQWTLDLERVPPDKIAYLDDPVFLGTPLEPDNWGRWLVTVLPKLYLFADLQLNATFFCRAAKPWQRAFLKLFANTVKHADHNPGTTYICHDAATIEYSIANISVSRKEREIYGDVVRRFKAQGSTKHEKLFISRISHSKRYPRYRVLQNEGELRVRLESAGFVSVEPETLSIPEQIKLFSNAKVVVALGGAALYNVVFCQAGTKVVTIESGSAFLAPHSTLLGSLDLEFGIILGEQDAEDPSPVHKRWSLDIDSTLRVLEKFVAAA